MLQQQQQQKEYNEVIQTSTNARRGQRQGRAVSEAKKKPNQQNFKQL
jgi:hypothetical protein